MVNICFPPSTFNPEAPGIWKRIQRLMEKGRRECNPIRAMLYFIDAQEYLRSGTCSHYGEYIPLVIEVLNRLIGIYQDLGPNDCSFCPSAARKSAKAVLKTFRQDNPHYM
jgi:hypothetical protein